MYVPSFQAGTVLPLTAGVPEMARVFLVNPVKYLYVIDAAGRFQHGGQEDLEGARQAPHRGAVPQRRPVAQGPGGGAPGTGEEAKPGRREGVVSDPNARP